MTTEATPGALGSNGQLGLVPEREAFRDWYRLQPKRGVGAMSHGSALAAWQEATRVERERCAEICMQAYHQGGDPGSLENKLSTRQFARRLAERILGLRA